MTLPHTRSPLARSPFVRAALALGALGASLALAGCSGDASSSADDSDESALAQHAPPVTVATGNLSYRNVTVHGGFAYWTDSSAIQVLKAPLAGGAPTVLYTGRGMDSLGGIVVDDDGVYFNDDGQVLKVAPTGGKVTVLARERYDVPVWLAQDASYVYWSGQNENDTDYSVYIRRVKKTGGAIETVYTGYKGGNDIVVDDTYVYFYGLNFDPANVTEQPEYILRVKKDGSAKAEDLAELPSTLVRAIAVDDDKLYYASEHGGWSISAMPKSGGAPTELRRVANAEANTVYLLRATATSLYWATPGTFVKSSSGDHNATIHRMAKTGGRAQIVTDSLDAPDTLEVGDGACPAWTSRVAVFTLGSCP